jgi:hypothetical protein
MAVQVVAEEQFTPVAALVPKWTLVCLGTKPLPRMVTAVPPAVGPVAGVMSVTKGDEMYRKLTALLVPPGLVTVTPTMPIPGGLVAVHLVAEAQFMLAAGVAPKLIVVGPSAVVRLAPLIVTTVPPAAGPSDGLMLVTVGARA